MYIRTSLRYSPVSHCLKQTMAVPSNFFISAVEREVTAR